MSYLTERRRMEELQRRSSDEIRYRMNKREYDIGQRRLGAVIQEISEKAVRTEKDGRHDEAVKLAIEVDRLKRYQRASGQIGTRFETARAVSQVGRAMSDIAKTSDRMAGMMLTDLDPSSLSEAQMNLALTSETIEMMLTQSNMTFDGLEDRDVEGFEEAGEACLQNIMAENGRSREKSLLAETNRRLDRLQKARIEEKP